MSVDKYLSLLQYARFRPGQWLLMRPQDQQIRFSLYGESGWKDIESPALPQPSRFSRNVLLLPDQQCAFRHRSFPLDLLVAGDLDEAVALDMEQWTPFQEACDSLYFVQRDEDAWRVAVWVWPQKLNAEFLAMLPEHLTCTHIMPELAWSSACLRSVSPALLIQASEQYQFYAVVSATGVPLSMAEVNGEAEARRYCRAYASTVGDDAVFVSEGATPFWLADKAKTLTGNLPRAELLARARLPGVMDWTDPVAWKKPIIALAMMALLWLMADATVLSLRTQSVDAALVAARTAASQVLDKRDKVAAMHEKMLYINHLQRQQLRGEQLIARLSDAIPEDIWLNQIQLSGQWIDLYGQGKDVARLSVLLESVEGVKQVLLLGDIRPDALTGLEVLQLRLMLADGGGA